MNSCLYEGKVMHHRFQPKEYRFEHSVFMFYLDLDEIDELTRRFRWMSRNRFNLYSFWDEDHLVLSGKTIKENVLRYLKKQGVDLHGGRIMMLTNLRTMGHIFNPVTFFFCFDHKGRSAGVLPEVGNTFGELKPYWLNREEIRNGAYVAQRTKHFYISPFIDLDATLDFHLKIPGEEILLKVDDLKEGQKFFVSSLKAKKKRLSDGALMASFLKFPFITLKVIGLIHWHAWMLYLKKIPHHRKEDHKELQRDVTREYTKN